MPLILEIHVTGQEKIQLMLEGLALRARDLSPVWGYIANEFSALEARQFDLEGGLGTPWPALSPSYAAWKAKRYPGRPMMVLTGALFSSLVHGGPGHIDRRTPDTLTLGTNLKNPKSGYNYGLVHQVKGVQGKIRKTIVVPDAVAERWAKLIQTYVTGGDLAQVTQRTSLFGG